MSHKILFQSAAWLVCKRSKYHTLTSEPIMVSGQKSISWVTQ
jgi:hypothetical protein